MNVNENAYVGIWEYSQNVSQNCKILFIIRFGDNIRFVMVSKTNKQHGQQKSMFSFFIKLSLGKTNITFTHAVLTSVTMSYSSEKIKIATIAKGRIMG